MKFEQTLQEKMSPEWEGKYVRYKLLKEHLRKIVRVQNLLTEVALRQRVIFPNKTTATPSWVPDSAAAALCSPTSLSRGATAPSSLPSITNAQASAPTPASSAAVGGAVGSLVLADPGRQRSRVPASLTGLIDQTSHTPGSVPAPSASAAPLSTGPGRIVSPVQPVGDGVSSLMATLGSPISAGMSPHLATTAAPSAAAAAAGVKSPAADGAAAGLSSPAAESATAKSAASTSAEDATAGAGAGAAGAGVSGAASDTAATPAASARADGSIADLTLCPLDAGSSASAAAAAGGALDDGHAEGHAEGHEDDDEMEEDDLDEDELLALSRVGAPGLVQHSSLTAAPPVPVRALSANPTLAAAFAQAGTTAAAAVATAAAAAAAAKGAASTPAPQKSDIPSPGPSPLPSPLPSPTPKGAATAEDGSAEGVTDASPAPTPSSGKLPALPLATGAAAAAGAVDKALQSPSETRSTSGSAGPLASPVPSNISSAAAGPSTTAATGTGAAVGSIVGVSPYRGPLASPVPSSRFSANSAAPSATAAAAAAGPHNIDFHLSPANDTAEVLAAAGSTISPFSPSPADMTPAPLASAATATTVGDVVSPALEDVVAPTPAAAAAAAAAAPTPASSSAAVTALVPASTTSSSALVAAGAGAGAGATAASVDMSVRSLHQQLADLEREFFALVDADTSMVNAHYKEVAANVELLSDAARNFDYKQHDGDDETLQEEVLSLFESANSLNDRLRCYVELNYMAFVKILKKHDKLTDKFTLGPYLSAINRQPFYEMIDRSVPYTQQVSKNFRIRYLARSGDINALRLELDTGASPSVPDRFGTTALIAAAKGGWVDCVRELLTSRANPSESDNYGVTALIAAARNGHPACVTALITAGANVHVSSAIGLTALHYAAERGAVGCARLLINANAAVNAVDAMGSTPLLLAAEHGHADVVALLLGAGADASLLNATFESPLSVAATGNHHKVVKVLLEVAQAQALGTLGTDKDGELPTSSLPLISACVRGNTRSAAVLIRAMSTQFRTRAKTERADKKKALRRAAAAAVGLNPDDPTLSKADRRAIKRQCKVQRHQPAQAVTLTAVRPPLARPKLTGQTFLPPLPAGARTPRGSISSPFPGTSPAPGPSPAAPATPIGTGAGYNGGGSGTPLPLSSGPHLAVPLGKPPLPLPRAAPLAARTDSPAAGGRGRSTLSLLQSARAVRAAVEKGRLMAGGGNAARRRAPPPSEGEEGEGDGEDSHDDNDDDEGDGVEDDHGAEPPRSAAAAAAAAASRVPLSTTLVPSDSFPAPSIAPSSSGSAPTGLSPSLSFTLSTASAGLRSFPHGSIGAISHQLAALLNLRDRFGCSALIRAAEYGRVRCMRLLLDYGADPDTRRIGRPLAPDAARPSFATGVAKLRAATMSKRSQRALAVPSSARERGLTVPGTTAGASAGVGIGGSASGGDAPSTPSGEARTGTGLALPLITVAGSASSGHTPGIPHPASGNGNGSGIVATSGRFGRPMHATALTPALSCLSRDGADSSLLGSAVDGEEEEDEEGMLLPGDVPPGYDGDMATPLIVCAITGHLDGVRELLQHGAQTDLQDSEGSTALMWAADRGHGAVVRELIAAHAAVDLVNQFGQTALMRATVWNKTRWANEEALSLLLAAGAQLDVRSNSGSTALIIASTRGHARCVEKLIAAGASLEVSDSEGCTALLRAAMWGNIECVSLLLSHGAHPDVTDLRGRTPLIMAAAGGHYEIVEVLLTHGADEAITGHDGRNARDVAIELGYLPLASLFKSSGLMAGDIPRLHTPSPHIPLPMATVPLAISEPVTGASGAGVPPVVQMQQQQQQRLISSSPLRPRPLGAPASSVATSSAGVPATPGAGRRVLSAVPPQEGALQRRPATGSVPFASRGSEDCAALRRAAVTGNHVALTLELARGRLRNGTGFSTFARGEHRNWIDYPDQLGSTALILAAREGRVRCMKLLLSSAPAPNVHAANQFGTTALHFTARNGYERCSALLLRAGADASRKDDLGNSTLHLACENGHDGIVQQLLLVVAAKLTSASAAAAASAASLPELRELSSLSSSAPVTAVAGAAFASALALSSSAVRSNGSLMFGNGAGAYAIDSPTPHYATDNSVALGREARAAAAAAAAVAALSPGQLRAAVMNVLEGYEADHTSAQPSQDGGDSVATGATVSVVPEGADEHEAAETAPQRGSRSGSNAGPSGSGVGTAGGPIVRRRRPSVAGGDTEYASAATPAAAMSAADAFAAKALRASLGAAADLSLTALLQALTTSCAAPNESFVDQITRTGLSDAAARSALAPEPLRGFVNGRNTQGATPLILAAVNNHTLCARRLLECAAHPDLADSSGETALTHAARQGYEGVVDVLIEAGANVNGEPFTPAGEAPVACAATPLIAAAHHGHTKVVARLLAAGAALEERDTYGATALLRAAQKGQLSSVRALLDAKANVNALGEGGSTALAAAAQGGLTDIVSLLLTRRARVDVRGEGGASALLLAADHGLPDCVRLLLKARASVDLANVHGHTPLIRTMYWNNNVWQNHESLSILLDAKADVNAVAEHGNTALHVAAFRGHHEAIAMLINAGADVDAQNYEGATPLVRAAAWGNIESMAVLIRLGRVDINLTDKMGRTALIHAATLGRLDAVRMLLDCGADARKCAYDGKSALDCAIDRNHEQVVLLLQSKAVSASGAGMGKKTVKTANGKIVAVDDSAKFSSSSSSKTQASSPPNASPLEELLLALRAEACLSVLKENGVDEPSDLLLLKESDWAELVRPIGSRRRLQAWAAANASLAASAIPTNVPAPKAQQGKQ